MHLLLFPDGHWMDAVVSWWTLDGCSCFLEDSGWPPRREKLKRKSAR